MIVKKHTNKNQLLLAACDTNLLGKQFEENELVLDLSSDFYNGTEMNESDFLNLIKKTYILNAVGEKTIELLLKNNMITKEIIKKISNVPHVQVLFGN